MIWFGSGLLIATILLTKPTSFYISLFSTIKIRLVMIRQIIFCKKIVLFTFKEGKTKETTAVQEHLSGISHESSRYFIKYYIDVVDQTEENLKFVNKEVGK